MLPRVQFTALLGAGLLNAGDMFYHRAAAATATVLRNGSIQSGSETGSIHMVASRVSSRPSNGWQDWFYRDENTTELRPLNELREVLRRRASA